MYLHRECAIDGCNNSVSNRTAKYCSRSCYNARPKRPPLGPSTCVICGDPFYSTPKESPSAFNERKTCGSKHGAVLRARTKRAARVAMPVPVAGSDPLMHAENLYARYARNPGIDYSGVIVRG